MRVKVHYFLFFSLLEDTQEQKAVETNKQENLNSHTHTHTHQIEVSECLQHSLFSFSACSNCMYVLYHGV